MSPPPPPPRKYPGQVPRLRWHFKYPFNLLSLFIFFKIYLSAKEVTVMVPGTVFNGVYSMFTSSQTHSQPAQTIQPYLILTRWSEDMPRNVQWFSVCSTPPKDRTGGKIKPSYVVGCYTKVCPACHSQIYIFTTTTSDWDRPWMAGTSPHPSWHVESGRAPAVCAVTQGLLCPVRSAALQSQASCQT